MTEKSCADAGVPTRPGARRPGRRSGLEVDARLAEFDLGQTCLPLLSLNRQLLTKLKLYFKWLVHAGHGDSLSQCVPRPREWGWGCPSPAALVQISLINALLIRRPRHGRTQAMAVHPVRRAPE